MSQTINKNTLNLKWLPDNLAHQVDTVVGDTVDCLSKLNLKTEAIVLSGGWKNQEITLDNQKIKTDIDITIFSDFLPLALKQIEHIKKSVKDTHNINIDIHGVIPRLLGKSRTFWAYKLKSDGIVLSGNTDILKRIQAQPDNLPQTEALRILFETLVNRLVFMSNLTLPKYENYYRIAKSYMYFGEAILALRSALAPTYTARRNNFRKISKQLDINSEISKKIFAGYDIKLDYSKIYTQTVNWDLATAKQDCLYLIRWFLQSISKQNNENKALNMVFKQARPRQLFNIILWYRLRKTNLHPKLSLINSFTVADLYKIVFYYEIDEKQKYDIILKRFFTGTINDKNLVRLFKAWPITTTLEII